MEEYVGLHTFGDTISKHPYEYFSEGGFYGDPGYLIVRPASNEDSIYHLIELNKDDPDSGTYRIIQTSSSFSELYDIFMKLEWIPSDKQLYCRVPAIEMKERNA